MNNNEFSKRLRQSIIIADGAVGTMVHQLSHEPVKCIEELNLTKPDLIREIHHQYIQAGSMLTKTNTFAANRNYLSKFGLENKIKEINAAAVKIAKSEQKSDSFIAGSMGPVINSLHQEIYTSEEEINSIIKEQALILINEGIDVFLLETFPSVRQLTEMIHIIRKISDIPIIASLTVSRSATTPDSSSLTEATADLQKAGANIIGLNCGYGIQMLEKGLSELSSLDMPLSAMANAGLPQMSDGRIIYGVSEEYFSQKAELFAEYGARIIGGCCGTTPSHIEAIAQLLKKKKLIKLSRKREKIEISESTETATEGRFLKKLDPNNLPIICEIDPPGTFNIQKNTEAIKAAAAAGADALSMAENPLATIKISNLAYAAYIQKETDIDIILHITGRDRNLLGLQSMMMGAHILNIAGLLMVTGDPVHQPAGPANVFDTNSIGLLKMAYNLNQGKNLEGKDLKEKTDFSLGAAVNPNSQNITAQIKHLKNKIAAGALFTMTQPVFEKQRIFDFLDQTADLNLKRFIGIFPILSSRTAEYLHNEVPGITVPEELRKALSKNQDKEYQAQTGTEYTKKLLSDICSKIDGLYLIAPHTDPALLAELVQFVKNEI